MTLSVSCSSSPGRRGGLLVQVLFAVALLGVLLPGLLDLLGSGDRDLAATQGLARAVEAAQLLVEQVGSTRILVAHLGQRLELGNPDGYSGLELPPEFVSHYRGRGVVTVGVAPHQTNPLTGKDESDLLEIKIEVRWTEVDRERSFRLVTRRALRPEVEQ